MRAPKRIIKNKKIIWSLVFFIVMILAVYITVWFKVKSLIEDKLNAYSAHYSIKYDSLRISGFPFIINATIKNLEVKFLSKSYTNFSFVFEKLIIKNLIFTKNINISVEEKVYYGDKENNIYLTFDNESFDLVLGKNNEISFIDSFIQKITFHGMEADTDLNNVTLKLITSNDYNYSNQTFRFNIDQIIYDDSLESNFEIIFSNVKEMSENNQIVKAYKNTIDSFVFNDITNNYSVTLDGETSASIYNNSFLFNLEMVINNYNSLIKSLNDESSNFIFGKEQVLPFVQFLLLIPKNTKDTINQKHYSINGDLVKKTFTINNMDSMDLLQKILFSSEIN